MTRPSPDLAAVRSRRALKRQTHARTRVRVLRGVLLVRAGGDPELVLWPMRSREAANLRAFD